MTAILIFESRNLQVDHMEDQCLIRDSDLDTGPQEKCDSNVYDCVCVWQGGSVGELQGDIQLLSPSKNAILTFCDT